MSASVSNFDGRPVSASKYRPIWVPSLSANVMTRLRLPSTVSSPRERSVSARARAVRSSAAGSRRSAAFAPAIAPGAEGVTTFVTRL